ncbi:MAG: hypothetical protein Q4Q62_01220 [Thermoplasmata archaeon]|nr:hypothetical protein [Thermoplasmata archaeon]
MADEYEGLSEEQYTVEEAVAVLEKTVERKRSEIEGLEKKAKRLKNEDSKRLNAELIAYMKADVTAYVTVIADMTDDSSMLEGIDLDADPVPAPENYADYVNGLGADDLENELEAQSIRADYCDAVVEDLCVNIGQSALESKKMLKALLDDPFALEQIGEVIFYDDYLYDLFVSLSEEKAKDKGKKKKKKSKKD